MWYILHSGLEEQERSALVTCLFLSEKQTISQVPLVLLPRIVSRGHLTAKMINIFQALLWKQMREKRVELETGLPPSIRIFKSSRGWPLCTQLQLRQLKTIAAGKDATHRHLCYLGPQSYFLIKLPFLCLHLYWLQLGNTKEIISTQQGSKL